jgi:hypothetical protein
MIETIWQIAVIIMALVFVCFIFVIAFGAPFLPTLKPQVKSALDLIDLKKGQTLLELGSGDGRVQLEAAKRGINSIGYELNPLLVIYSKLITWKYRKQVKIMWGNFWHRPLPKADGIFVFLLNPYMQKLDDKIQKESNKPVKLVSFAFELPNKKPSKKHKGLYLYVYK